MSVDTFSSSSAHQSLAQNHSSCIKLSVLNHFMNNSPLNSKPWKVVLKTDFWLLIYRVEIYFHRAIVNGKSFITYDESSD